MQGWACSSPPPNLYPSQLHYCWLSLCRLWCRFDIVLLLLDEHEPTWDRIVSEHVLTNHQQAQQPFLRQLHGWSVEELRSYVTWAKAECPNLTMSNEAEQVTWQQQQLS